MNVDSFTDFDSQPIVFQIESYLDNYEVEIWEWDIKREWETGEHNITLWKFLLLSKQASTYSAFGIACGRQRPNLMLLQTYTSANK